MVEKRNLVVFALAFLIILSGLAFADHIIKTSSGGTSYNYNSSSSNVYNITVNNTDSAAGANITQVNITLPSGISINLSSNWTDANGTFSSSGSVLSWQNSAGLVMNLSWKYFAFSATATPGAYNLTITTINSTNSYSSNISVTINDTTPPIINYTSAYSNGSYVNKNYLIFNLTATDYSGVDNLTLRVYNGSHSLINISSANSTGLPLYLNVSNLTQGNYYYNITVNDTKGNVNNSETRSLLIDTTRPVVDLSEYSDTEDSITMLISITENGSGIGSLCTTTAGSVSGSGNSQTLTDDDLDCGTSYSFNVTCTDRAGNSNSASDSFSTHSCSEGSSGDSSGGGSETTYYWTSTFIANDAEFKDEGYTMALKLKERIKVKIGGESHYVGIVRLTSTEITINVSSTPQQAVLRAGESKKFEVTNDSYYDVQVILNSINATSANITVKSIYEKIPEPPGMVMTNETGDNQTIIMSEETNEESSEGAESKSIFGKTWFWIILGAIIIIAAAVAYYLIKVKHLMIKRSIKIRESV